MRYEVEINAEGDPDALFQCFSPEIRKGDRSSFTLEKQEKGLLFRISASDATALRATLHSITKLLGVYEKLERNGREN